MSRQKSKFPCFISLEEKKILVVGAGHIAERRIGTLLGCTDLVYVAAGSVTEQIAAYQRQGLVKLVGEQFDVSMLEGMDLVLACTDDPGLNHRIALLCRERRITVNNCSDQKDCDFFFPSIVQKDEIVIGISGDGTCHRKVRQVREMLEALLSEHGGTKI